jgi:hypothetical protein
MVLGGDDPVRGRTVRTKRKTQVSTNTSADNNDAGSNKRILKQNLPLPGDVEVHHLPLLVLHGDDWEELP